MIMEQQRGLETPCKEDFDRIFDGKAIGGNSSEVVCIPFMLDIGDINISIDSEYRKNLILEMDTINGIDDESTMKQLEETWERSLQDTGNRCHRYPLLRVT